MDRETLSPEDIEVFEALREEYDDGYVQKRTAVMAKDIYNLNNKNKIDNCMCSKIQRRILGKEMLDWFEA